jgi:3-methyladenine DNA glycosylase AlkC
MIEKYILNRKGPRSRRDVLPEALDYLNKGLIETKNLSEWLVVDFAVLVENVFQVLGIEHLSDDLIKLIKKHPDPKTTKIGKLVGEYLIENLENPFEVEKKLRNIPSDLARGWGCKIIGWTDNLKLLDRFEMIEFYATDPHFGVREEAWAAMRNEIEANLEESIEILAKWSDSENENKRRFASEATRPRGVWTKYLKELVAEPWRAISILEPLRADDSKYVRDSVGNWLNDAGKSHPDWVRSVCEDWQKKSKSKETDYIVRRAMRNLCLKEIEQDTLDYQSAMKIKDSNPKWTSHKDLKKELKSLL